MQADQFVKDLTINNFRINLDSKEVSIQGQKKNSFKEVTSEIIKVKIIKEDSREEKMNQKDKKKDHHRAPHQEINENKKNKIDYKRMKEYKQV